MAIPVKDSFGNDVYIKTSSGDGSLGNPYIIERSGSVTVSNTVAVSDNAGSLTVDGSVGILGVVPVSDNSGSLTVDGSVSITGALPSGSNALGSVSINAALPTGANVIGLVTPRSPGATVSASIASSGNLTPAVDLGAGNMLAKIQMSSGWDAASITFQASADNVTYQNLYDDLGAEVTVAAAASRAIALSQPALFAGYRYLKIRSGTSGTPVTQTAQRDLTLIVLPL